MNRHSDPWGYFPHSSPGLINRCYECGTKTTGLHHVLPVSKGGTKQLPFCEGCHNKVHGGVIMSALVLHGLAKAKARGVKFGAPTKITTEARHNILILRSQGLSFKKIAIEVGLSVGTVHKTLRMLQPTEST